MSGETREPARLTHSDERGRARMVDVSSKEDTRRTATASGSITMSRKAFDAVRGNAIAKGDVIGVARIAGIMAAKRTPELIPLCHPIAISSVEVDLSLDEALPGVRASATVVCTGATGVEMEAVFAVTVALTTIYDMAKSADRAMRIGDVRLIRKTGGKSGDYSAP